MNVREAFAKCGRTTVRIYCKYKTKPVLQLLNLSEYDLGALGLLEVASVEDNRIRLTKKLSEMPREIHLSLKTIYSNRFFGWGSVIVVDKDYNKIRRMYKEEWESFTAVPQNHEDFRIRYLLEKGWGNTQMYYPRSIIAVGEIV
jgi:hypothetical protein